MTEHQSGKLPSDDQIKAFGERLIAQDGPQMISYAEDGGETIHFLARKADTEHILRDAETFTLPHYDELLKMVAGDIRFLLGDPTDSRRLKRKIVTEALGEARWGQPFAEASVLADVAKAVDETVNELLGQTTRWRSTLKRLLSGRFRNPRVGRFNLVWDFAFLVPYRIAGRFFGLNIPERPPFWARLALALFWLFGIRPSSKDRLAIITALGLTLPVNLHIFSNFEGRNAFLRFVAHWGARAYGRFIDRQLAAVEEDANGSVAARLKAVRGSFPDTSDDDFHLAVKSILFELYGTMIILVGRSFTGALNALYRHDIEPRDFAHELRWADVSPDRACGGPMVGPEAEQILMEAMRFDPVAARLYRRVAKDTDYAGTSLKTGDYICLLMDASARDPRAFPDPGEIEEGRPLADYLLFGPAGGPHACKGQNWARAILVQMFQGLARLPNLRPYKPAQAGKGGALGVPLSMALDYGAPQPVKIVDTQRLITVCAAVKPSATMDRHSHEDRIDAELDKLGNPASKALKDALDATHCVHFASLSLIRGDSADEPSFILFEISADGAEKQVLDAIDTHAGALISPVYELACGLKGPGALRAFLGRHCRKISPSFFRVRALLGLGFQGTAGLEVDRIRLENKVAEAARKSVEHFRVHHGGLGKMPLVYIDFVRQWFRAAGDPDLKAALKPGSPLVFTDRAEAPWIRHTTTGIGAQIVNGIYILPRALLIGPLFILALLVYANYDMVCAGGCNSGWSVAGHILMLVLFAFPVALLGAGLIGLVLWLMLRRSEANNLPQDPDRDPRVIAEIMARENKAPIQNQMIGITEVLPGFIRPNITLPFAMRLIAKAVGAGFSRSGFFDDIGTIHFARWVMLPGTRKLVFFSNYDGSFESYLEDFITKAIKGVTGVWSNCIGFPKTKNLFWEGGADGDRFKRYARRSMVPTRCWYSAYPYSAQQVRINAMIRDGIARIETASSAEAWMELFNSSPRPPYALESEEIQNMVFGGASHLQEGRCLLVRFGPDRGKTQDWLKALKLTFGDSAPATAASYLALSHDGLAKLGMDFALPETDTTASPTSAARRAPLTSFPPAFFLGMDHPSRVNILQDKGASAAENWTWGSSKADTGVDAALILYGNRAPGDDSDFDTRLAAAKADFAAAGLTLVHEIRTQTLTQPVKEPFGFTDGISQPILEGTRAAARAHNSRHVVAPGEILLGYQDNRGYFPPTLQVPVDWDRQDHLPDAPDGLPGRFPDLGIERQTRDFGRNGSFLVIRQLAQDVNGFWGWAKDASDKYHVSEEWVAAKLVGRWRDGRSLVRHPYDSADEPGDRCGPDNDFSFGQEDPQGLACPFGAHIRRANPRDSLNPTSPEELSVTNRHRILRRGRPYEDGDEKGTLFMCLNADIERQFEFVQQNWLLSPSFHGLQGEVDPLSNNGARDDSSGNRYPDYMVPDATAPMCLHGLRAFVTVRGGAYFFLPSAAAIKFLASLDRPGVKCPHA